jgi:integrase
MATFEKRRNTAGEITAIRVKIRRVGMPHLSKSFPVENGSQTALKKAEKAAKVWVDEITKGFDLNHGNFKSEQLNKNNYLQPSISKLTHAWAKANNPPRSPITLDIPRYFSREMGEQLIIEAHTNTEKILTALLLECGLSIEEILQLRWQHVHLNQKVLLIMGSSGLILRQVPLSALTIEMLLASHYRKYGMLINLPDEELNQFIPQQLTQAFGNAGGQRFNFYIKREAAHRMADLGTDINKICQTLGIYNLESLNLETQHKVRNQYISNKAIR